MTETPMVWLDFETTGLDPEADAILQVAVVFTGWDLVPQGEPIPITIHQPDEVLDQMSPRVREMHQSSGLLDLVRDSRWSLQSATDFIFAALRDAAEPGQARLCGSSIHFDRRFMAHHMPELDQYLHYRMIDVSVLLELCRAWGLPTYRGPDEPAHLALPDIQQSIAALKFYRETIFSTDKEAPMSGRKHHLNVEHLLQFFTFAHLPPHIEEPAARVAALAFWAANKLPESPELAAGLRKLLEAKDCLVRAALVAPKEG
ncbi:MAG: oligoribonuclease [Deltaproteobacteria bacterium]|nr:oligoribonuclease [Deltaproteobacteria bacterium]